MASLRVIAIAVLVLVAVFHTATSLVCLRCGPDFTLGGTLGIPCIANATEPTCPADDNGGVCIQANDGDDKVFYRNCGTADTCKRYASCDSCTDKNLCNSADIALPSFLVFGIVSAIIVKHFY